MQVKEDRKKDVEKSVFNKNMQARFYIKYQKSLKQIHQQDILEAHDRFILKGMIQTFGNKPEVLTQEIIFTKVNTQLLDFIFYLYDADKDLKGGNPYGTEVPI